MLYKLLGMAVWHGGKRFVRRRYGRKPLVAGAAALALVAGGAVALAAGRRSE